MNPTPTGWPRLSSSVFYREPRVAIDWLCRAFGFEIRLLVEGEGGRVEHCELEYGEALVMIGGVGSRYSKPGQAWRQRCASPADLDGRSTQHLCLHIDDADAHCARSRAAGAVVCYEPTTTDYGADYWCDRSYACVDPEGHVWWFLQRISTAGRPHAQ